MKSIYDMQNEKDYFYHYNEFLHILEFEKFFEKNWLSIIGIGYFRQKHNINR